MSERPHLPRDERDFIAEALVASHTALLMRYDGVLATKPKGLAHLAADEVRDLLVEYRKLKRGAKQ